MREPVARHAAIRGAARYLAERAGGARLHAGDDLIAPGGTPVVAPERGLVVLATADADSEPPLNGWAWRGYGPGLVVIHGADTDAYHLLGHVDDVAVRPGDVVQEGEQVAVVAAAHGHCHWEVRSMFVPPPHASVVETTSDPMFWLHGVPRLYDPTVDGGPSRPEDSWRTPYSLRPSTYGLARPFAVTPFADSPTGPVELVDEVPAGHNARERSGGGGWLLLGLLGLIALSRR